MLCWCLQAAKAVLSQMKRLARALWSNPPTHGARIAAEVVGDADMFEQWKGEVSTKLRAVGLHAFSPCMWGT